MPRIDSGDTAWMLISAALVLLLTPALAFFYGGLARRKNMLPILTQCLLVLCLISLQWVLFGYSLTFGPDLHGTIGNLAWRGLRYVGADPNSDYAATIPHVSFMIYEGMVAVFAAAFVLSAYAERLKFSALCLFTLLWSTLVYDPVAHWVWGSGGFLHIAGVLDFAGGVAVQINAGVSALVVALMLRRPENISEALPNDFPLAVFAAPLLWVAWFGLSAGGAWSSGSLAASALVATHTAAAAGGLTWAALDGIIRKHTALPGLITGAVAGLVAITSAAGFVTVFGAISIGLGAALICYGVMAFIKKRFDSHDALNVFAIQGVAGIWGTLATGLWATRSINPAGADGLFYGNPYQVLIQLKATLATILYTAMATFLLIKVLDLLIGFEAVDPSELAP